MTKLCQKKTTSKIEGISFKNTLAILTNVIAIFIFLHKTANNNKAIKHSTNIAIEIILNIF